MAREIAAGPVKRIGLMKKILNQSTYLDLPSLLELEAEAQEVCTQTEDHKIRVQAFLTRKKGHVDAENGRRSQIDSGIAVPEMGRSAGQEK